MRRVGRALRGGDVIQGKSPSPLNMVHFDVADALLF